MEWKKLQRHSSETGMSHSTFRTSFACDVIKSWRSILTIQYYSRIKYCGFTVWLWKKTWWIAIERIIFIVSDQWWGPLRRKSRIFPDPKWRSGNHGDFWVRKSDTNNRTNIFCLFFLFPCWRQPLLSEGFTVVRAREEVKRGTGNWNVENTCFQNTVPWTDENFELKKSFC